ncbi:Hypothetical predicted protein [Marmota monax]|uniref:Uncharacterized protein n=1 Tax=Marmota monax TaxID=9995 RepID=A0A5E4BTW2_MARMO|nr:hypothetical protein GHT09_018558 [Marmota monax]VTJ72470.1 Hypothetical predicted protein [Marmota monax]
MGDGKKVISLADNHLLLWDLQESSSQAVEKEKPRNLKWYPRAWRALLGGGRRRAAGRGDFLSEAALYLSVPVQLTQPFSLVVPSCCHKSPSTLWARADPRNDLS